MDDTETMQSLPTWEALYGPNVGYAIELYERYLADPSSVDDETRAIFERLGRDEEAAIASLTRPASAAPVNGNGASARTSSTGVKSVKVTPVAELPASLLDVNKIVLAARIARGIREYGHLAANIDPLGAPRPGDPMLEPETHGITDEDLRQLPPTIVWPAAGPEEGTCLDAIKELRAIYCGSVGYEFDHVQDFTERTWLHESVESGVYRKPLQPEQKRDLLKRLSEVEGFETFLHSTFQGQKRFSLEGNDMLVPMLDEIIRNSAEGDIREVLIGMAHRGRLNVLTHLLGKPYEAIFSEFHSTPTGDDGSETISAEADGGWTGDVKYHYGAQRTIPGRAGDLKITLADNPSHLEVVDPVVAGFARAAQDNRSEPGAPRQDTHESLPVTIHGDAAFPGEGVVAETLNLSRLPGYQTGGTLRIIVNNQIGFTTQAADSRSTLYASDLAKGFEIPIVHVNADDPEACLSVVCFAVAYRERFRKDFLIDLVGYRRWGHNEADEPAFTQPLLYDQIRAHPSTRALYAERLEQEGAITADEAQSFVDESRKKLQAARQGTSTDGLAGADPGDREVAPPTAEDRLSVEELHELNDALLARPENFTVHRNLERILSRRKEALDRPGGIDWALAETLAFATILSRGTPIRLAGQDTARGTFSQRHLVLYDTSSGASHIPLQSLSRARASFAVYNSPLTEMAVLGFEYGYSVHSPEALVVWEAQFGDFANVGQVILDQFISAAWAKWRRRPALVLLLPHGYEGQGPEHSSARLERYLQLAAEDNLRVANCSTAAQYFHLLRLQASLLSSDRRPLILMTPKSLLRHPRAGSSIQDLTEGHFQPVLDDWGAADRREKVERLILCTGKVAVDLTTTAVKNPNPVERVAVARVELLYPFPEEQLRAVISGYPHLKQVIWLQEEPRNQGAWSYMAPRLEEVLPKGISLAYLGRSERASTAVGSDEAHQMEQREIIEAAFEGERRPQIETRGVQYVD